MNAKHTKKRSRTDWKRLRSLRDRDIDFTDLPPLGESFFARARVWMPRSKRAVSLRVDSDLLDWFKEQGRGYEDRINAALRVYVEAHKH